MESLADRAARLGIETEYHDARGQLRTADPDALARLVEALAPDGKGEEDGAASDANEQAADDTAELVTSSPAPVPAYQGSERTPQRFWVLAVQLYAVRSRRNWGHGDFTDLAALIELAADVGASGIGLNPLHALFDEWADASPYAPNSRLFLNPRYIDVEAVPEFPGTQAADLQAEVARVRAPELIDYAGVIAAKTRALRLAFDAFQRNGAAPRREAFDKFRRQRGASLTQFATFEHLRRKFRKPWWEWPSEWRKPQADAAERLRAVEPDIVFYEFVQWIAHEQLAYCCTRARARVLPIGLYLDIAVGVRADSYDAWSDQDAMLTAAEVGAPPDLLNTAGQKWGVVGFNPVALVRRRCEPFRRMLRASMRYAGAIRLDHVMQLKRLFLIPAGMKADKGLYIRLPFEALLATTSHESRAHECIVIGEDLGTVPEGFREALAAWGLWSYQVLLFERDAAGRFRAPEDYPEKALATFATHDLPTFLGWRECHDLGVKRALGIDPGETEEERTKAQAALADALYARGLRSLDLLPVMEYLAATPSRMLAVTLEDVLGWTDQVNIPGTVDEHPNWRRRTGVPLEDFSRQPTLTAVAEIMAKAGRSIASA